MGVISASGMDNSITFFHVEAMMMMTSSLLVCVAYAVVDLLYLQRNSVLIKIMMPKITEVMTAFGMARAQTSWHVGLMTMLTSMLTICAVLVEVALSST